MQVGETISEELEANGKASCGLVAEKKQKLQKHYRNQSIFMQHK